MKKQTRWYGRDWDYGIGTGDYHVYSFPSEESMRYWLGPDSDLTRSAGDETDAYRAMRIEQYLSDEILKRWHTGCDFTEDEETLIELVSRGNALNRLRSGEVTDVEVGFGYSILPEPRDEYRSGEVTDVEVGSGYCILPEHWDEYRDGWSDDDPAKSIAPQGVIMMVTVPDGKVIAWYDEYEFLSGGEGTLLTPGRG